MECTCNLRRMTSTTIGLWFVRGFNFFGWKMFNCLLRNKMVQDAETFILCGTTQIWWIIFLPQYTNMSSHMWLFSPATSASSSNSVWKLYNNFWKLLALHWYWVSVSLSSSLLSWTGRAVDRLPQRGGRRELRVLLAPTPASPRKMARKKERRRTKVGRRWSDSRH